KAALQSGALDVALGENGLATAAATVLLVLDPSRAPFDAASVRLATAEAVDRGELVRHWLPGGEAGLGLLVPRLLPTTGVVPHFTPARTSAHATLTVTRAVRASARQRRVACL